MTVLNILIGVGVFALLAVSFIAGRRFERTFCK
jgi:hypothetical protein